MGLVLSSLTAYITPKYASYGFRTLAAVHYLTYSTLLGQTLYQTFVMTSLSYKALPSSAFTTLQKRVFPVFFKLQALLTLATMLSWPFSPKALRQGWDAYLLATTLAMALMNWRWYGPLTSRIMSLRIHQEHKDGNSHVAQEKSEDMKRLNRKFSVAHAMSIHLNLVAVVAMLGYGVSLASSISLD